VLPALRGTGSSRCTNDNARSPAAIIDFFATASKPGGRRCALGAAQGSSRIRDKGGEHFA
jgi:hypothetical protein